MRLDLGRRWKKGEEKNQEKGGFTVCREPRFLLADGRRPADVYLAHSAANLNDECLDLVVCSVIRDAIVDRVPLEPSLPMDLADKRKERQVCPILDHGRILLSR